MTLRTRLVIMTAAALAVTMAVWGWVQIEALDRILVEQQGKRISSVAETVSTFYQRFPTGLGLTALDTALKEQVQSDVRLARIDIFTVVSYDIDYIEYIAGASRVAYEWPEILVSSVAAARKPYNSRLQTVDGPAVGLLYPVISEKTRATQFVVGVVTFSRANMEILPGRDSCWSSAPSFCCSSSSCCSPPATAGSSAGRSASSSARSMNFRGDSMSNGFRSGAGTNGAPSRSTSIPWPRRLNGSLPEIRS